jgi:hypothetical protein
MAFIASKGRSFKNGELNYAETVADSFIYMQPYFYERSLATNSVPLFVIFGRRFLCHTFSYFCTQNVRGKVRRKSEGFSGRRVASPAK